MTIHIHLERAAPPSVTTLALAVLRWLAAANDRARQRRALAELDDRLLNDIGISRDEADAEGTRLHWWRR
jgi:uncharacterized protein YjiS (DUF1127 family)